MRRIRIVLGAAIFAVIAVACGGKSQNETFLGDGGASGSLPDASAGNGGTGGSGGTNYGGSGGAGGTNYGGSGGVDSGPLNDGALEDHVCAAIHASVQTLPLDLFLMVDRSASMDNTADGHAETTSNPDKWTNQSVALSAFFNDGQNSGVSVALGLFPLDDNCAPQEATCSGEAYATPLVNWGQLPGNAGALTSALTSSSPDGCFTPTQEALNGVLKGAYLRQQSVPTHAVAAVIVSDGTPCCGDCPTEAANDLGAIAKSYYEGTPSIRTFAIFSDVAASDVMTAIAAQGGTTEPFDATGGKQAFIDALNAIRIALVACEFKIPEVDAGVLDPNQIEVDYHPSGSSNYLVVPKEGGATECGTTDGWYFDNPAHPSRIVMCPSTCNKLKIDQAAVIDILFTCKTH